MNYYNIIVLYSIPLLTSLSWLLGNSLITKMSPLTLSSSRVVIGAGLFFFLSDINKAQANWSATQKIHWWFDQVVLSITGRVLYFYISTCSLKTITPFEIILISTLLPIILLLMERLMGQKFKNAYVPLLCLISFVFTFLSLLTISNFNSFAFRVGHLQMVLAMILFAIHLMYYKSKVKDVRPWNPLFAQFLIASVLLIPFDVQGLKSVATFDTVDIVQFFIYAIICNLLPYILVHYSLKFTKPFVIGAISLLSPLFSFFLKWFFVKQEIPIAFIVMSLMACLFTFLTMKKNLELKQNTGVDNDF